MSDSIRLSVDGRMLEVATPEAFDSNAIIAELDARGAKVVISQHPRRAIAIDEEMYKWRHLIETSSAGSRSSNASPCAPTRPIKASPP